MKKLLVGLAFAAVATGAQAQQFTPMQNDQMLLQAINSMAYNLGGNCQMGISASCQAYQYIMSNAGAMSQASNACLQGNQQGCQYYAMYYQQMERDYGTWTQSMQSQGGGGYNGANPLGNTHQERMAAIQNFGAQNTQNYQQRMNQMEQNQQQWMSSQGY